MKKTIGFIFALTLLASNSFADITFWTTEVQPARMENKWKWLSHLSLKLVLKLKLFL